MAEKQLKVTAAQIEESVEKSHTHSNLSTLNNITSSRVSEWDDKADKEHRHNASEIDGIENLDVDLSNYYTKTQVDNKIATEMDSIDLSSYAKKSEIPNATSDLTNDSNFATQSFVTNKINEAQLSGGSGIDLSGYATKDELSAKANISAIPTKTSQLTNDSGFITTMPSEVITETELEAELINKVDKVSGKGLSTNDLTNEMVTKINNAATQAYVANAIAEAQLEGSDVDLSGLATKDELNEKAPLTHSHNISDVSDLQTALGSKVDTVLGKSLVSDTEIARLANVDNYDDSEIRGLIPTKVSDLTNDRNYLTSIPSEYVTETELNAKSYATETFVTNKIAEASGATAEQAAQIEANKTAIGDTNSGLIKEVNDIKNTELQNLNAAIQTLETLVGVDETVGDRNELPEGDANIIASINRIDGKTTTGDGLTSEQTQQLQTAYEHSQSDHVTMDEVDEAIANAQLGGGEVDATSFATDLSLTGSNLQLKNSAGNLIGNSVTLPSGGTNSYELPIASATTLGGIKVGTNLSIDSNGVLNASSGSSTDLSNYYKKTETYSKLEVDNAISDIVVEAGNIELENYVVGCSIKLDEIVINYGNIVTSTTSLTGNEATSISFTVKLDSVPNVNQTVKVTCGDAYITVSPATLTFTPSNYSTAQTVTVQILENPSYVNWNSTIYVSSTDVATKSITVNATNITNPPTAITSISLDKSSLSLKEGEIATLVATKTPSDTTNTYSWKSSDNSKATVKNGVVTAIAEGSCIITCYSDADESIKAECSVTIATVQIESITLQETATVSRNRTITLTPTIVPSDITSGYSWSVDNENATVENGVVTGVNVGSSVITCYSNKNNEIKDTCTVTINELEIESISLNQSSASVKEGKTITLTPTIIPSDATVPYVWETSDDAKATVEDGVITGVGEGKCTITCKSSTNSSIKAECTLTVESNTIVIDNVAIQDESLYCVFDARDGSNSEQTKTLPNRVTTYGDEAGTCSLTSGFGYNSDTGFTENGTLKISYVPIPSIKDPSRLEFTIKGIGTNGYSNSPTYLQHTISVGLKNVDYVASGTQYLHQFIRRAGYFGNGYGIGLSNTETGLVYSKHSNTAGTKIEETTSLTNIFATFVWNDTSIELYINGQYTCEIPFTSTQNNGAYYPDFQLYDSCNGAKAHYLEFSLFTVHTRALKADEILQNYNSYIGG